MSDEAKFTKADLDKAIEDAKAPLDAKNKELLDEVKKIKADLRKTQEINPADLEKLEAENERLKTELSTAQKAAKDATAAQEKATKALEAEQGVTHKLLVQDGLKSALLANGVKDEDFIDTLTAKFTGGAKIVVEGEERKVMLGDKPLADAIKEFAASESGKKFVAAPANGGGGAQGNSGGNAAGKTITRQAFDALGQTERMAFTKEGGKVVDQAA